MRNQFFWNFLIAALFCTLAVGCGGDDTDTDDADPLSDVEVEDPTISTGQPWEPPGVDTDGDGENDTDDPMPNTETDPDGDGVNVDVDGPGDGVKVDVGDGKVDVEAPGVDLDLDLNPPNDGPNDGGN